MKNTLLKQGTINLALIGLVSLLGACATSTSPRVENQNSVAQQRSNSGPLVTRGYAGNGNNFTVRQVYGWPPIGE
jgi:hypothetical protein